MVESALNLAEAGLIFHGLALKPGSPTLAAVKDGKLIIGFSGNPAAAMVSFELVAVPILNKLMGLAQVLPSQIQGIMAEGFDKPSPQRRFLRARLLPDSQGNRIQLTGTQGNSVLSSMIGCNLLVDIPEGSGAVTPGQLVTGWLIT